MAHYLHSSAMSLKKKTDNTNKGRSLEEDIQRLQDNGIISEEDKKITKKDTDGKPTTKEQQQTGDTERSDRRL